MQTQQTLRSTQAVYTADMGRAMQGAQDSEGRGRSERADQSQRHRGEASRSESDRADTYRARSATHEGDHTRSTRRGLRHLESRRGEGQSADKTHAGDRSAMLSALRRGPGESEAQQRGRLLRGTQASDQDAEQAFSRLPQDTRSQLQSNGRTQQAKQYLKFQLQMNRLRALKEEAQQAGDSELAEQLQAVMDELATQEPEIPSELTAAESADDTDGADDTDETDETDEAGGETGATETGEGGDTTRRVGTARDTGEQQGGEGEGDGQPQTGGAVAAHLSQPTLSPSLRAALDEGQLGFVSHTGGSSEAGGTMATEHRVLGSIVQGDSRVRILADSGDHVRLVRVRARQGGSGGDQEGFDPQPLESRGMSRGSLRVDPHSYGGETRLQFSAATGGTGTIGIYQLQAALQRTPPGASHVEIGNRYLEIEDVDQQAYAGMVGSPATIGTGEAAEAIAYHRQVGLIRARGLVGRGWSGNMDSFAQTGFLPAQAC